MPTIPVLTPAQSSEWDRRAEAAGVALATLMDAAGRAVAAVVGARFPERMAEGVLVAVGSGNNGGDGWVLARALHRLDVPVWVAALPGEVSPLARTMAELAHAEGVRAVTPDGPWPNVGLVVDAILGTGARGAPRAPAAALVERINDLALPVVAVDGPTGVDLESGVSHGIAVHATLSVTFGGLRRGHLLAREEVGDLVVVDIGHPPADATWPRLVSDAQAAAWLPAFHASDHKGTRGRVVVIGGDAGMSGALRLAARAAFGAGAGLVHAVSPVGTTAALMTAEPDLQAIAHPLEGEPSSTLVTLIERADAIVIGPGLGRTAARLEFIVRAAALAKRVVIDADGLYALSARPESLNQLARDRDVVLTPHPGEFRILFSSLGGQMELDPWGAAEAAARSSGCTVLLKGVPTVVAKAGQSSFTVAAGNPGLATGGSGDVLSGLVGTALAHGLEPASAAALGAQILGRSADLAARRTTARGLRPMDVVGALPDLWRTWRALKSVGRMVRPPILLELESPERW
jgi:ADP-dependent NAD(P)H-hydrate dehydratase / NAD(P)H-hydrate epimerase